MDLDKLVKVATMKNSDFKMAKKVTLKQHNDAIISNRGTSASPAKKRDFIAENKNRAGSAAKKTRDKEVVITQYVVTSVVEKHESRANHTKDDLLDATSKKRSGSHDKAIADAKKKVYTVPKRPTGRLMNKKKIEYAKHTK